jgi:alginate O-acetyltransferase complex protein AlgI
LTNKNRNNIEPVALGRLFPSIKELSSMLLTFGLTVFAWIFFRATSIRHAMNYIGGIFDVSILSIPHYFVGYKKTFFSLFLLISIEWLQRNKKHGLELSSIKNHCVKWSLYYAIIAIILEFGANSQSFIYFQF